jgi:hypothetical protein
VRERDWLERRFDILTAPFALFVACFAAVTADAERDQVRGVIGAAVLAGDDVMSGEHEC